MFFASSRRIVYSSSLVVVVLLFSSVLQIWVCSDCKAGAIRVFPENGLEKLKESKISTADNVSKEDRFRKYFNGGRASGFNTSTEKGLEENKRRVPSCPDPLHN